MIATRTARLMVAGTAMVLGAMFAWYAIAAADTGNSGPGRGMTRMEQLMESGNPGMAQMHERMMQIPGAQQAHERMMQVAAMAQRHQMMMVTTGSSGS